VPIDVRVATLTDASAIGEVHVLAWQTAYRRMMPDEYLDGLLIEERVAMWSASLGRDDPSQVTLVVTEDDAVVGFAAVGPGRGLEPPEVAGELYAINLHPARWREGLGSRLLEAAVTALADLGHDSAMLWVVDANERARRFYERHGWTAEGIEKVDTVLGAMVTEVRYRRSLSQPSAGYLQ